MNRLPLVTTLSPGAILPLTGDKLARGDAGFDLAQFERIVGIRDPDASLIAFVDQRLLWYRDRRFIAAR